VASTRTQRPGGLVGRARELGALEDAVERVVAGVPWGLELVGEPGIGKSRLLAELGARAERRGCLVLDGRAAEFEREAPFGLLLDVLNDYLRSLDPAFLRALGDETVAELAPIFPALATLGVEPASFGLQAERYRAHYAIRALLERLAARQPLVLALDDVHWADEASIEAVAHLLRRLRGRLLVVAAARRPVERLATAFEVLERRGGAARLELAPLTHAEGEALLGSAHDAATRADLYRQSGGNPFYLEELARAATRGRRQAAGRAMPALGDIVLPAGVATAIAGELADLSENARRVLDAAAIAGDSFEPELLAVIAASSTSAALDGLDELLSADLVRQTAAPRVFRFRHPIVRRAVYERAPAGWRLAAHARAAKALSAAGAAPADCAQHVERSAALGDESSVALLVDAAHSVAARAPLTAGRWLQAALRLLPADAGAERQLSLLTEAAGALGQAGAFDESLDALERAAALVAADRPRDHAALVVQIAAAKRLTGHPMESQQLLERALRALSATDPAGALALRSELVIDRFFRGEFTAMEQLASAVRDAANSSEDRLMESLASALASIAASSLGQIDRALDERARAHAIFRALSDEGLAARIDLCGWLGLAAVRVERVGEALADVGRGIALARRTGQSSVVPGLLTLQCRALLLAGRVSDAAGVAETATDAAILTGNDDLVIVACEAAAMARISVGDLDGGLTSAQEAVARSEHVGESYFAPLARLTLAAALHARGDTAAAQKELAALDARPADQLLELFASDLPTRIHLELGELDQAAAAAERAIDRARKLGLPQQRATAACAHAAVLLARGDAEAAAHIAAEAVALAEGTGNQLLTGRAHTLAGAASVSAGDRAGGAAALERGHALLTACGATREAQHAARELRRLGHRVSRPPRVATGKTWAALSPREREVADQVAAGKTNREVAAALYLSEKTIESHLARIYDKLGLRSRTALAALVARATADGHSDRK
jgi:DNA-binding CsgD family transcriptional regulator